MSTVHPGQKALLEVTVEHVGSVTAHVRVNDTHMVVDRALVHPVPEPRSTDDPYLAKQYAERHGISLGPGSTKLADGSTVHVAAADGMTIRDNSVYGGAVEREWLG